MDGEVHPLIAYAVLACIGVLVISTVALQLWTIYTAIWNLLRA
jgi:hypothetical protein